MATPPTFTNGTMLYQESLNAIGLWLVKSQAVGTGVSSVTVTGAFSADYDNYRITWTGGSQSADVTMTLQLGSATSNYYGSLIYGNYAANTVTGLGQSNTANFAFAGGSSSPATCAFDLYSPYLTTGTELSARIRYATVYGTFQGLHNQNQSFTSFTLAPSGATMTGGTIRVYGLRN